jgi:hypothetical protein
MLCVTLIAGVVQAQPVEEQGPAVEPAEPPPPAAPAQPPPPSPEPVSPLSVPLSPEKKAPPTPGAEIGGVVWAPSAELRMRGESRLDSYTAGHADEYFVTSRARLGLSGSVGKVLGFVQLQDARNFGASPPGNDGGANTGLHQGYLELREGKSWLRAGRQEVNFGEQRLVGAFPWGSAARSFDGLRLHGNLGQLDLDLLGAVVREIRQVPVAGPVPSSVSSKGDYLAGAYATYLWMDALNLDAYVLYRHDSPTEGTARRNRNIASPGLRLFGKPMDGLTYKAEGTYQLGRANRADHTAYALTGETRYELSTALRPGLALGGSYATGADGDTSEFDNFYPTNHPFYGTADLFGLRNLTELYAKVSVAPNHAPLKAELALHRFGLAAPGARWTNAAGILIGQSATNTEGHLGHELDLNLSWVVTKKVNLSAGYSVFLPGQGARNLGHPDPTHWAYLMLGSVLP